MRAKNQAFKVRLGRRKAMRTRLCFLGVAIAAIGVPWAASAMRVFS
jgi:hypothetical protein